MSVSSWPSSGGSARISLLVYGPDSQLHTRFFLPSLSSFAHPFHKLIANYSMMRAVVLLLRCLVLFSCHACAHQEAPGTSRPVSEPSLPSKLADEDYLKHSRQRLQNEATSSSLSFLPPKLQNRSYRPGNPAGAFDPNEANIDVQQSPDHRRAMTDAHFRGLFHEHPHPTLQRGSRQHPGTAPNLSYRHPSHGDSSQELEGPKTWGQRRPPRPRSDETSSKKSSARKSSPQKERMTEKYVCQMALPSLDTVSWWALSTWTPVVPLWNSLDASV